MECIVVTAVFDLAIEKARSFNGSSVALTFPQHPASYLRPGNEPPLLMSALDKAGGLLSAGVDAVILQPFDHLLSNRRIIFYLFSESIFHC